MKECTGCHLSKPLAQFYRLSAARDGLNPQCKVCVNEKNRAYHEANKERQLEWKRRAQLRRYAARVLGLDRLQYESLLARADGRCEVCGRPEGSTSTNGHSFLLAIDHDHVSDRVRGMLCRQCNTALGCVQDSPAMLRKLADYLENPPGVPIVELTEEQRTAHLEKDLFGQTKRPRTGWKQKPETRVRMSASLKGIPSKFKGVPRSPEVIEKIRQGHLGQKRSDEARANMRAARFRYLTQSKEQAMESSTPEP